ncbi:MAG: hypothetical protein V9G14_03100 [Cypionkella sp.]
MAMIIGTVSGSCKTRAAKSATITGSVLIQAVVTAKERDFINSNISAVAPICAPAPIAVKANARSGMAGMLSPVTSTIRPRKITAKGRPNRNRT